MKNKIVYLLSTVILIYCVFLKISYNRKIKSFEKPLVAFNTIKNCIEIEERIKGKFPDLRIKGPDRKEIFLYDRLDREFDNFYVLVITSLETCSTCREQTLKIWDDIYKKDNETPIILIISEDREIKKGDTRKTSAYLKGSGIQLPNYLDSDSILLGAFGVTPNQTPLSLIVRRDKKIIAANKTRELTVDRTIRFKNLFLSLISKEE
ncbi:MAG: hypothetical protein KAW12_00205 [Candidatus Aminicenantes bacterium]|nr:hypothetical protein [Candidatus Aminicenantes bacterium]